jgi:hypothetical protein
MSSWHGAQFGTGTILSFHTNIVFDGNCYLVAHIHQVLSKDTIFFDRIKTGHSLTGSL